MQKYYKLSAETGFDMISFQKDIELLEKKQDMQTKNDLLACLEQDPKYQRHTKITEKIQEEILERSQEINDMYNAAKLGVFAGVLKRQILDIEQDIRINNNILAYQSFLDDVVPNLENAGLTIDDCSEFIKKFESNYMSYMTASIDEFFRHLDDIHSHQDPDVASQKREIYLQYADHKKELILKIKKYRECGGDYIKSEKYRDLYKISESDII